MCNNNTLNYIINQFTSLYNYTIFGENKLYKKVIDRNDFVSIYKIKIEVIIDVKPSNNGTCNLEVIYYVTDVHNKIYSSKNCDSISEFKENIAKGYVNSLTLNFDAETKEKIKKEYFKGISRYIDNIVKETSKEIEYISK